MSKKNLSLIVIGILIAQALILHFMGRLWVCDCDSIKLWYPDANGSENSQHFFDPYFFSHIVHGLLFFVILLMFDMPLWKKLLIALGIEVAWEIVENTPMTIERYRAATISLGYTGDTILNSVMDTVAMIAGFWFAAKNRLWTTVSLIILIEIVMAWWIKDNLLLNVIMLLYPLEWIREWQAA
ncbi:MAG: DUF2585 family protein [Candidatus Gracilibacteria bacterium]|nr:DUF2585 family protein [Candidatus Gracilibacteria bacterium]